MADEVVTEPQPDPEPDGVIEIDKPAGQKEKVVPVAVLTAERERIRKAEAEKYEKEIAPLKAKAEQADKLAADVQAMQPYVEHLKRHPELLKADEPPALQQVSDEDAEKYARRYELYTATGLDLKRAKQIIADNRAEMKQVAQQAAQKAGLSLPILRSLGAPLFIVMVLAMMVLPLPPFALDLLFTFNIATALMVMVVASYMVRPLDFAAFPSVLYSVMCLAIPESPRWLLGRKRDRTKYNREYARKYRARSACPPTLHPATSETESACGSG